MGHKREKSDSITHLVKVVAGEVFDEKMKSLRHAISYDLTNTMRGACLNIQSSLEKAGRPWHMPEDTLLIQEVNTAIAQIAKNHSRSPNAISIRIREKGLLST